MTGALHRLAAFSGERQYVVAAIGLISNATSWYGRHVVWHQELQKSWGATDVGYESVERSGKRFVAVKSCLRVRSPCAATAADAEHKEEPAGSREHGSGRVPSRCHRIGMIGFTIVDNRSLRPG